MHKNFNFTNDYCKFKKYTSINIYIIIIYNLLFCIPNRKILKNNKYCIVLIFFSKEDISFIVLLSIYYILNRLD